MLIDLLEEIHPGIRNDAEITDAATPLSYEKYSGSWQGSICVLLLTPETLPMNVMEIRSTSPGLEDFYMAGQWVGPGGGLTTVAKLGRSIIQQICAEDNWEFTTRLLS